MMKFRTAIAVAILLVVCGAVSVTATDRGIQIPVPEAPTGTEPQPSSLCVCVVLLKDAAPGTLSDLDLRLFGREFGLMHDRHVIVIHRFSFFSASATCQEHVLGENFLQTRCLKLEPEPRD